jgi:hypothetical protein
LGDLKKKRMLLDSMVTLDHSTIIPKQMAVKSGRLCMLARALYAMKIKAS